MAVELGVTAPPALEDLAFEEQLPVAQSIQRGARLYLFT
jgi:hypothetical protein